jgi:hypothetical protein
VELVRLLVFCDPPHFGEPDVLELEKSEEFGGFGVLGSLDSLDWLARLEGRGPE